MGKEKKAPADYEKSDSEISLAMLYAILREHDKVIYTNEANIAIIMSKQEDFILRLAGVENKLEIFIEEIGGPIKEVFLTTKSIYKLIVMLGILAASITGIIVFWDII